MSRRGGKGQLQLNGHASIARATAARGADDRRRARFGPGIAFEAMVEGIDRARRMGILRDRAARRASSRPHRTLPSSARARAVSFHFVNVPGDLLVAPLHGTDPRFGTNLVLAPRIRGPAAAAARFSRRARSRTARRASRTTSKRVPAGSLIDFAGQPTDDPAVMHEQPFGALLPFGLHKGTRWRRCAIFGGALVGGHTTYGDTLQKTSAIVNGCCRC